MNPRSEFYAPCTLGIEPAQLAQDEIDAFHRDMDGLGLTRPDDEPRVTRPFSSVCTVAESLQISSIVGS